MPTKRKKPSKPPSYDLEGFFIWAAATLTERGKKAAAPFRYARGEKEDSVRPSYSNLNIAVER